MFFMLLPLILIVMLAFYLVSIYNSLVNLKNQIKNAWAQIDVQLKRRHDLIPNLIETVKGYVKHERETLENITKARSVAMSAGTVGEKSQAENALSQAMGRLFAVAESYPDLKANQNSTWRPVDYPGKPGWVSFIEFKAARFIAH